jgi:hypothetical protein
MLPLHGNVCGDEQMANLLVIGSNSLLVPFYLTFAAFAQDNHHRFYNPNTLMRYVDRFDVLTNPKGAY